MFHPSLGYGIVIRLARGGVSSKMLTILSHNLVEMFRMEKIRVNEGTSNYLFDVIPYIRPYDLSGHQ